MYKELFAYFFLSNFSFSLSRTDLLSISLPGLDYAEIFTFIYVSFINILPHLTSKPDYFPPLPLPKDRVLYRFAGLFNRLLAFLNDSILPIAI